jgi:signal transduction histidine kinase
MPAATIRSRLLLLVLAWAVPAVAATLFLVFTTAQAERDAHERTLRETARALSLVIDRELAQRRVILTVLAASRTLDHLPDMTPADAERFIAHANDALRGIDGWVQVSVAGRILLDTRPGGADPVDARALAPVALVDEPAMRPLRSGAATPLHASMVVPVRRGEVTVGNLAVTILPSEMQRIIDDQRLPADWVSTVLDSGHLVVARHPGGLRFAGAQATSDLRDRLHRTPEGAFESTSLEGNAVTGYFSTSPMGWTFLTAMPRAKFGGLLQANVLQVAAGATLLLLLAVGGALWVSRSIARPVLALRRAAERLQAGEPVAVDSTGIVECDRVVAALAEASETLRHAHNDLERQVSDAVDRTRDAEQRLSHSQRVEALGRLTGGVAHDFNNLLGVIANSARLVQRKAMPAQGLEAPAAAILRAVDTGSRLTQQLLRFAGRRPVKPAPLDLARWLPDLGEMLRSVVGERIRVQVSVAPGTLPVTVDSSELELAIINLALNARDAMRTRGGLLHVGAHNAELHEVEGLGRGAFVAISVADDGAGIDEELSRRIFEPFFTTKPVGQGTGLGLAQVHGFCAQAGGAARLASREGRGTTVTLLLPAGARAVPPPRADAPPPGNSLRGVRLLLVEDNVDLGEATAALLAAYGADVQRVAGAEEALHAADVNGPHDVVLTDVVMPGPMDGVALARALRERHPRLPVVLISGYSAALDAVDDLTVLRKPCPDRELVAALLAAVDGPVETA